MNKHIRRAIDWIESPQADVYFRGALMLCFFAAGLSLIGYQIYQFLYSGHWMPMSVITGLAYLGADWANSPKSWFGLHGVLDFIPLWVLPFALAWMIAMYE